MVDDNIFDGHNTQLILITRCPLTNRYTGSGVPPVFIPRSDRRSRVGSTVVIPKWSRSVEWTVGAPAATVAAGGGLAGTVWHAPWTKPSAFRRRLPRSALLWSVLNRREWLPARTDHVFYHQRLHFLGRAAPSILNFVVLKSPCNSMEI